MFSYVTELLMFVYWVILQHRGKESVFLVYIKECKFSVALQQLLFKMTSTVLYAQFCVSQNNYQGVMFARHGSRHEGSLQELILYNILQCLETLKCL